ncbi:MAG: hypothetical protein M1824_004228 [Vezdaea acicularis]|nr:MAG: hypothetical protein M1824_004228 [Vezdaea acicularis]
MAIRLFHLRQDHTDSRFELDEDEVIKRLPIVKIKGPLTGGHKARHVHYIRTFIDWDYEIYQLLLQDGREVKEIYVTVKPDINPDTFHRRIWQKHQLSGSYGLWLPGPYENYIFRHRMERLRAIPHAPLMSKEVVEFNLQRDPNDWPFDSIAASPIDLAPIDPISIFNLEEGNYRTNNIIVKLPPQSLSEVTPPAVSETEIKQEDTVSDGESATEATAERLPLREVAHNSRVKPTLLKDNGSDLENKENAPAKRPSSSAIKIFEDPEVKDITEQEPVNNRYRPDKRKQAEKAAKRAEEKRCKNAEKKSAKEAERAEKAARQKAEKEAAVDKSSEVVAAQPMREDSASKHASRVQGADCTSSALTTVLADVDDESALKDQSRESYPLLKHLRSYPVLESAVDRYDHALAEKRVHPDATDPAYQCTIQHAGEILMKRLRTYLEEIKNLYADISLPQLESSWECLGEIRKRLQIVDKKALTVVEKSKDIQTLVDDGAVTNKDVLPIQNAHSDTESIEIDTDSRTGSKAVLPDLNEVFDEDGNFINDAPPTEQVTYGREGGSDHDFSAPVHKKLIEVYESGNGNTVSTPNLSVPLNRLGRVYAPNKSSRLAQFQMSAVVEERGLEEARGANGETATLIREQSVPNNTVLMAHSEPSSTENKSEEVNSKEITAVRNMDVPTETTTDKETATQPDISTEERDALIEASASHWFLGQSKEFHSFEADTIPTRTRAKTVGKDSSTYRAVSIEELKEASRKLRMPVREEPRPAASAQIGGRKGKSKKRAQNWLPFDWKG